MAVTSIRQRLYDYIRVAEERKIKAIYVMLEDEIEEVYDHWNDKEFIAELNKRSADYKSGRSKAVAWEEAKAKILNSHNAKKK